MHILKIAIFIFDLTTIHKRNFTISSWDEYRAISMLLFGVLMEGFVLFVAGLPTADEADVDPVCQFTADGALLHQGMELFYALWHCPK